MAMNRYFRYLMFVIVAVQAFAAVALILRLDFAMNLWPFPNTSRLSFLFIASIFAAAAASTLWCLLSKEDGALAGIALNYVTIFVPVTIFAFQLNVMERSNPLILFGFTAMFLVVFGAGLFLWSSRIPIRDPRPLPRLVGWSFVIFVLALLLAGSAMILKTPNIMPWTVTPEGSVIYGWMLLGAAAYFIYGLLRPSWHNAAGQLVGFLAYDVVLIVPFIQHFANVPPDLRPNLIIYTLVLVFSGLVAIYYLFINPATREIRPSAKAQPQTVSG
jgi:hypothetical protein